MQHNMHCGGFLPNDDEYSCFCIPSAEICLPTFCNSLGLSLPEVVGFDDGTDSSQTNARRWSRAPILVGLAAQNRPESTFLKSRFHSAVLRQQNQVLRSGTKTGFAAGGTFDEDPVHGTMLCKAEIMS